MKSTWAKKKLGDLAELKGRIGWRGLTAKEYTENGPLFLSVHSLNYGDYVDFRDAFHISEERYVESPEIMLQQDDVLICKDGAGIGKVGIIGILPDRATINSSLLLIRSGKSILPKFLYRCLSSPYFQQIVNSRLNGATTPHLYQRDITEFPIVLPPLPEQQRIVDILDKAFDGIAKAKANTEKNLQNARALFESHLKYLFSVRNDSWINRRFGDADLLEIIDGDRGINYPKANDFFSEGHCLFLNTKNVRPDGFDFESTMFISEEKDRQLRKGKLMRNDVVLTTRGTIGNIGLYTDDIPFDNIRINSGMLILRPNRRTLLPEFLFELLRTEIMKEQIRENTSGAAQPQLPIRTLVNFTIPAPKNLEDQRSIVQRIQNFVSETKRLEFIYQRKLTALDELQKSLLHQAFNGELTSHPNRH